MPSSASPRRDPGRGAGEDLRPRLVPAAALRRLRRTVLYAHLQDPDLTNPQDERPGAFHLGVMSDSGEALAGASYAPEPLPIQPGRAAYRLRGMAVMPEWQHQGLGSALFAAGLNELARRGAEVLWANARDTALDFYRRQDMEPVGNGFLAAGGLPHHLIVLDMALPRGSQPGER